MSRQFTNVDIFCDMGNRDITLSANALNRLRILSLKKAGGNFDDNDVVFGIHDFPVKDRDRPEGISDVEWFSANIACLKKIANECFTYGKSEALERLGIQKVADLLKKYNPGMSNEDAFEIASNKINSKRRPSTHILWIADDNAPSFVHMYVKISNSKAMESVEELERMRNKEVDPRRSLHICCLEECPYDYDHEAWFGDSRSVLSHVDREGKERKF